MIFPDTVQLTIDDMSRTVQAIVTFLDSSVVASASGANLFGSRFRIYLSPYGEPIPARGVTVSWREFTGMIVEGLIEPHYLRGRLHHYECITRTV